MQTRKNIQARLKAITLALLLGSLQLVHAAIDPVTAIVSLAPPYTPFINEYATTGTNKLQVTLIVNDSRLVNHPARLQMVIERADGSGSIMATNEYAAIAPILLTGQTTEILTGADLAPYFMAQNNMFTGFSQSQYVQTGRIPDGQYRIGFRVVDAQRGNVVLSNVAYTQPGWFVLNDPPLLNLPRNKEGQRVNEPQYLKLEWFPRHLGSMNSAFAASYKVELFAIRVPGMDPQQVAMSMQPDYSEETTRTNLYLTPDKYLLEPGVEYAWRVKAFSDNGLALFQNNGHSEVYSFVYGDLCPTPENVEAEVLGPEKAVISWGTDPAHTSYEARFRAKGKENARWHTRQTFQDNVALNSLLSPGMSYEYQVKAKSPTAESGYSPLATFTTPEINKGEKFECGSEDNVKVDNQNPKEHLKIGDMIYNGGFPVKLTEVSGSNGVFTGKGRVRIPFLANVQVNMEFKNIRVNEQGQVYKGKLVSVYNPKSKFYIDDITDYWSVGDQVGNIVTGREAAQIELGHTVSNASDIKVAYNDNTNMVTVTSTSGGGTVTEHVTSTTGGTTISDAEGNLYAVDEGGNVAKAGKSGGNEGTESYGTTAATLNQLDNGQVVTFFNAGGDKWAFDEWQPAYNGKALIEKEYENISGYRVPWKLVPAGKPGKVYAEVTKGDIDISKVAFKTPAGTVYEARKKGRGVELAIIGSEHGDGQEIYALYQQGDTMTKSLGKLKVASYNMVARKLFIVPVNQLNVNVDEIEKGVNEIFLPYGVEWDVKLTSPFLNKTWDLNNDGMLDAGESGMFSMYTPEMKALNRAYETSHETDEEAIYVFVLTKSTGTTGLLLGDMPISSKFGYLFSPKGKDITSKTVAHEIAHGMFQLKHTFDEDYALEKSKTDNLMDYAGGTSLFKQQWDAMYDQQALLFAWLQDEGEGAYIDPAYLSTETIKVGLSNPDDKTAYTCLTPAGIPITVFDNVSSLNFTTRFSDKVADGSLTAFTNSKGNYIGLYNFKDQKFLGYALAINPDAENPVERVKDNNGKVHYYSEEITSTNLPATQVYLGYRKNCAIEFKTVAYSEVENKPEGKNKGDGELKSKNGLEFTTAKYLKTISDDNACILPPLNLTKLGLKSKTKQAVLNPYGQQGLLMMFENGGNTEYIYQNTDLEALDYYYRWDNANSQWVEWKPQTPHELTETDVFLAIFAIWKHLLVENPHEFLDAVGMVPVLGEPADIVNGIWYFFEDDKGNAILSMASIVPMFGDVIAKGTKYTIKSIKSIKLAQGVTLTVDGLTSLSKICEILKVGDNIAGGECAKIFARLLEDFPEKAAQIEKLAEKIKDTEKLKAVLTKIDGLPTTPKNLQATFFSDLAENSKFADEFLDKLAENDGLIESWKVLSNGKASLRSIDNINAVDAFRAANPNIADDAIQAAFDGLKASRRQAFVNALGSCADNKNLIGSLNKTKLASVDEIKDALNKMRDYKTGKPQSGNLGYLEDNIQGVALDKNKMWESVSLDRARNETHIFDAIEATGSSGTWLRITDSEYRMLNDLAKKLKAVEGGKYPDVTGTLKIVSENPYCPSCQGVIQQFSDMFPNIEIKLIDGIR